MYHMIFAKQVRIICILIYILISCIECNEIFVKQAKIICIKYEYHEIIVKNHIFSVFYRKISNKCFKKRQILGEKEVKYEYHEIIAKQANITFFLKTGKSLVRKKWSDQADETMGDYLCGQVFIFSNRRFFIFSTVDFF